MEEQSSVLNLERVKALESWLERTNTKLVQVNGQRKYGGPPSEWAGPPPGSHCEVFISHLPREVFEDVLLPLFGSVGPLWEFRLMMNFSGQNRGFAYAKYGSAGVAAEAVRRLHGYMLDACSPVCVQLSTEKRRLCIANLPHDYTSTQLLQELRAVVGGVEKVCVAAAGKSSQSWAAVVTFSSHHSASMAKKVLVEEFQKRLSLHISLSWHSPGRSSPPLASPQPHPSTVTAPPVVLPLQAPQTVTSPPNNGRLLVSHPVELLQGVCGGAGLGLPVYHMSFSHAGPDGFLHFNYSVQITGLGAAITGQVLILPGASAEVLQEEARRAAAQQVLHKVLKY